MKYFELFWNARLRFLLENVNIDNVLFFTCYFIRSYIKLNVCFDWQIMIVRIRYCVDETGDVVRIP